jgi:hypothetical protein
VKIGRGRKSEGKAKEEGLHLERNSTSKNEKEKIGKLKVCPIRAHTRAEGDEGKS